jgi:hypothetical protein
MFAILSSAFNAALGFLLRQIVVKFVVLFSLWFVVQVLLTYLISFLPNPDSLSNSLLAIPPGIWWFMDLFAFTQGASLVVTSFVYRFLIRRMPVIG